MQKVLITGGAGYIGSMLSTKLLDLGYHVTVIDLLKYDKGSLNHLYFYKNFELLREDVRKKDLIKKKGELFYHLEIGFNSKTKLKFYFNLIKHNVLFILNIDKMN